MGVKRELAGDHVELDLGLGEGLFAGVLHSLVGGSKDGVLPRGEVDASGLRGSSEELEVGGALNVVLLVTEEYTGGAPIEVRAGSGLKCLLKVSSKRTSAHGARGEGGEGAGAGEESKSDDDAREHVEIGCGFK